jgi:alkanesulfonate monooxygenase SsuD/methylene tetrahydromethanopterin reductase-like flavin-dependent oxidoreductase (luciferase family)
MARLVSNIDHFSGGRFIFGVGVGNAAEEFAALGADHEHRGAVGNDYLRAMLALWSGEGFVSYEGRYAGFKDVSAIKTRQQPHPPIWVGGNTERAWRRAVLFGQAWHPILWRNLNVAYAGETALPGLRQLAESLGRPMPAFCPRIRLDLLDEPLPFEGREAGTGSLEQIRDDLVNLRDLGAEHVTLDWFTGDLEATRNHERGWQMLATLAEQVLDLPGEGLR